MAEQLTEVKRHVEKALAILGHVSAEEHPELGKIDAALVKAKAGLAVADQGLVHEHSAARIVDAHSVAILNDTEGLTTLPQDMGVRVGFVVAEATKKKVDAATVANANRGGGGGRGGRGGQPRGRGAPRGRGGGRGGAAGGKNLSKVVCYSCNGVGHLSANCTNKKNA
jgi:hypothetical protein